MTLNEYNAQRNALMDEVNQLLTDSKADEANAKMDEVTALDEQWDAIRTAAANANALAGNTPGAPDLAKGGDTATMKGEDKMFNTIKEALASQEYLSAWYKNLTAANGKVPSLTADEAEAFEMVNEYTHTTGNTGVVVPDTVAQGIWTEVEDLHPYYADILKTSVSGILTLVKSTETTDAAWYDEDTATEDAQETFGTLTLSGCELARSITVSWKLKEMAMDEFMPYITTRLAERMGAALGYGVINGQGPTADKPEPTGVVTALKADGGQVVTYTSGALKYEDLTNTRALIKSGYAAGLKIYANAKTIWGELANLKDGNERPLFINDPTASGVYRILGIQVVEEAGCADGDILFSNAKEYQANINKQVSVATEDHVKARTTDIAAYCIIDGAPLTVYAHALLTCNAEG